MRVSDLQYDLPPDLIAQHPADRRDASRLLMLERASGRIRHEQFRGLPELLPPRSLLVLNDTRVLPARLALRRRTGGRLQALFLREPEPGRWELMVTGAARLKPGEDLLLESPDRQWQKGTGTSPKASCENNRVDGLGASPLLPDAQARDVAAAPRGSRTEPGDPRIQRLRLIERVESGVWQVEPLPGGDLLAILNQWGSPPLPPYIKRERKEERENGRGGEREKDTATEPAAQARESDLERYQTVYARVPGAVAAPTAGLHFTPEVFQQLSAAGMSMTSITLHVGVGTFAPIRVDDLREHPMHAEWYECPPAAAAAVNAARDEGCPIVAVGTTSVRVLETCADETGRIYAGSGQTHIFIYPPYRFRAVDAMLTNFHLPGSTLLALIFAFAGRDLTLAAYNEAIRERYRFYSYGDAMLIM